MFTVEDDQLDGPSSDNVRVVGKRTRKTPRKFKDSMQGNELEDVYSQIGVTKRRTIQLKPGSTETIARIEDQDGVILGEMLSITQESHRSTRYQCDFCKELFVREFAFYNHLSYHTNIIYECTECQARFQAKAMFDKHVRETNHSGLGIIETPSLEPPSGNHQHEITTPLPQRKQQIKKRLKKFVCIKCPKSFDTNLAMQRHQKTHSENRPFQCDICLAEFKRKSALKVHRTSHTKEHPFECHKCSKRFSQNRSLQLHLQGIHDGLNPYSCPICKKCFSQKSNLEIHKRIHTGERPYICLKCGSAFKTSSQCHLHQKTHVIEENVNEVILKDPIDCKICGQLFTQRSNMIKHLRIHTGEKPYTCNVCQQKFSDSSNFKKHKQNHPKEKKSKHKPVSLLKQNLNVVSSKPDPGPGELMAVTPNSFTILENIVLPNVNNLLMDAMNEDDEKNANQWNSDVIVTDIPNDENLIAQQQQQQEMLMNQLVCISHQDPMNPVGSKKTCL